MKAMLTSKCPFCNTPGKIILRPETHMYGVIFESSFYTCVAKDCQYSWATPMQMAKHHRNMTAELVRERDYYKGLAESASLAMATLNQSPEVLRF